MTHSVYVFWMQPQYALQSLRITRIQQAPRSGLLFEGGPFLSVLIGRVKAPHDGAKKQNSQPNLLGTTARRFYRQHTCSLLRNIAVNCLVARSNSVMAQPPSGATSKTNTLKISQVHHLPVSSTYLSSSGSFYNDISPLLIISKL